MTQAKRILPTVIIRNGEDIKKYRIVSEQIYHILKQYGPIEKLGLDENFIDITSRVNTYIDNNDVDEDIDDPVGHKIDDNNRCRCGCIKRLIAGSIIANQMRQDLVNNLQVTSTAGIAHNKLLAKLVGASHKPNQQTTIYPNAQQSFLLTLNSISQIPGIGHVTSKKLEQANIDSIDKIRYSSVDDLKKIVGNETFALQIKDWSLGIDESSIKEQDQPNSIGCEDTIEKCFEIKDVLKHIKKLLHRVWDLVLLDNGRKPEKVRLTIRKKNFSTNSNERISREISFDSNFLGSSTMILNAIQESKFLSILQDLLLKIVNTNEQFEINLVGISFSNFKETFKRKHNEINENASKKKTSTKISNFFQKL